MKINNFRNWLPKTLLIIGSLTLFTGWLYYTPNGLLGKADAVGYAICHRIADRSFSIEDRPLPLCSRCSGMYLGAFIALIYQLRRGRRGGLPNLKGSIVLGAFLIVFGFDSINSYLYASTNGLDFYTPQNWLRYITGTGMGIGMAAMLYPIINQSFWKSWIEEPAISSWRHILEIVGLTAVANLLVLSHNPLILYPLSIISTATVITMLTLIYTIIWLLLLKKENQFTHLKQLWWIILLGFDTAILQISVMDFGRYWLTGTWNGFNI